MNTLILLAAGAAPDTLTLQQRPECPGLARWLVRGGLRSDRRLAGDPLPELPEDAWLRECLGIDEGSCVRGLEAHTPGLHPPWWSLRPCHVHLGMDHALLADPQELAVSQEEAAALAGVAAPVFAEAGLALVIQDPQVWRVQGPPLDLSAWPWNLASGRDISAYQPHGSQARAWRRMLTEVQMLWHEHPVNTARAAQGQRSINALWLDGFVRALPTPGSRGLLLSAEVAMRGIAGAAGWRTQDIAQPWDEAQHSGIDTVLVDLGFWRRPRRLGDDPAWLQAWASAQAWLQSADALRLLETAQRSKAAIRIVLTGERRILELAAQERPAWRFWQRFDPMQTIIGTS